MWFLVLVGSLVVVSCGVMIATKSQKASEDCMLRKIEVACNYVNSIATRSAVETQVGEAKATEAKSEQLYDVWASGGSVGKTTGTITITPTSTLTPTTTPTETLTPGGG